MFKGFINWADRWAIILSALCVVHCVLLPILLIALPTLTSLAFFSDERFHTWLLYAVLPISGFAVILGYLHHRSWPVVVITSLGMGVLITVAIFGHETFGEQGEVMASVVGSALVAFGHVKNFNGRKLLNRCNQTPNKIST